MQVWEPKDPTGRKTRFHFPQEWLADWSVLNTILAPTVFAVGMVFDAVGKIKNVETDELLDLSNHPVLKVFMSLPAGPKLLDVACSAAGVRSAEAKVDLILGDIQQWIDDASKPSWKNKTVNEQGSLNTWVSGWQKTFTGANSATAKKQRRCRRQR